MIDYRKELNSQQYEAVTTIWGPIFVFAGAGSGKTKVLTYRIAYLIEKGYASPSEILGITFTNKAAKEMKERVGRLVGNKASDIFLSTFHSFCLKVLREDIEKTGIYHNNFVIYDETDQLSLITKIIKENYADTGYSPREMKRLISHIKSNIDRKEKDSDDLVYRIYRAYQKSLISYNALDFDDLLLITYRLFKENEEIRKKWASKFKFIMIDEFQDTSLLQFNLIYEIAKDHENIMVVGDDDQTIYSWRGANIDNIFNFEKIFKKAKIIKLERNYRSTQEILNVANSVIEKNIKRTPKKLWNDQKGEKVEIRIYQTEEEEAEDIISEIFKQVVIKKNFKFSDIAILYRANHNSRIFEEYARLKQIPYKVVGGKDFYSRKEIVYALSYLKVLVNPLDTLSLIRVLEYPPKGIGEVTINRINEYIKEKKISFFEGLNQIDFINNIPDRAKRAIKELLDLFNIAKEYFDRLESWQDALDRYMSLAGVYDYIKVSEKEKSKAEKRILNIKELGRSLDLFKSRSKNKSLKGFLDMISLISDSDISKGKKEGITLMTVHASKGLEFPFVILPLMVDGNFPSRKSIEEDEKAIEEERRLFYVAITRAKRKLLITAFLNKMIRGNFIPQEISPFIEEAKKSNAVEIKFLGEFKNNRYNKFDRELKSKIKDILSSLGD